MSQNARSLGAVLVFLLVGVPGFAQPPAGPVTCPTAEPINDVVCASPPLQEQAREVERLYLAAAAADWGETQRRWFQWQYEFLDCGRLVGHGEDVRACISMSFSRFAIQLSQLATPGSKSREALYQEADVIMAAAEDMSRQDLRGCVQREASALDDGISSARDIAVVTSKRCRFAAGNVARILASRVDLSIPFMTREKTSPAGVASVRDSLVAPDDLIELVLELRAAKRKNGKAPQKARPLPAPSRSAL